MLNKSHLAAMAASLLLIVLVTFSTKAQLNTINNDSLNQAIAKSRAELDSLNERINNMFKPQVQSTYTDTAYLTTFMNEMNERNRKEKRNMWIRLGFGLFMLLVILPLGIMRQIKMRKKNSRPNN